MQLLQASDLGAGAGEGYDLIVRALSECSPGVRLRYRAIDRSAEMLKVARSQLGDGGAGGDIEYFCAELLDFDFSRFSTDLFVSVGVPFSHVDRDELTTILSSIAESVECNPAASVIVIDVLGRFSLEWIDFWKNPRRGYVMSFFSNTECPPVVEMTFYSRADLEECIMTSLPRSLTGRVLDVEFWDRSVFVGRHTVTGKYNSRLPRIRYLVNQLGNCNPLPDRRALVVPIDAILDGLGVPSVIHKEIVGRCREWNRVTQDAALTESQLCQLLRKIDQRLEGGGLGIGHSLTAVVRVSAAR